MGIIGLFTILSSTISLYFSYLRYDIGYVGRGKSSDARLFWDRYLELRPGEKDFLVLKNTGNQEPRSKLRGMNSIH